MKTYLAIIFFFAFRLCQAEESVQNVIEQKLGMKVDSVVKTDYLGLYEVLANGQLFYTDKDGSSFIVGNIIDGKSRENITAKRSIALLPFELAIKQVRGNGQKTLVTLEDPNCGYCRRLARDLEGLTDVTIYTFLVPILGGDSAERSAAIWCAPDRAKAWNDWMVKSRAPDRVQGCTAPVAKMLELGQRLKVAGTPTLMFENGERVPGAVPLTDIRRRLGFPDAK